MHIVIDIDENLYTRLFDNGVDNYDDAVDMAKAIRKGTPLDKIRAEIEDLDRFYDNDYFSGNRDSMFKCNEVLQILDKYKTESEDDI